MTGYEGSHQDWLEGQADDVLQREALERERCAVCGQADNCGDCNHFPLPGSSFDGGTTVASGWASDDHIGVLLVLPDHPGAYYRVGEYRRAGNAWECQWAIAAENIVPAARIFDDEFNFWGGN